MKKHCIITNCKNQVQPVGKAHEGKGIIYCFNLSICVQCFNSKDKAIKAEILELEKVYKDVDFDLPF